MISFFSPRTVVGALAPLSRIVKDLESVSKEQVTTIESNRRTIERLQADNHAADIERNQAALVLKALTAIIEPKE